MPSPLPFGSLSVVYRGLSSPFALFGCAGEPAYPPVVPGHAIELPRDAGSHPAYRVEWWYVTGWLAGEGDAARGFQVTFFRVRTGVGEDNPSRFAPRQLLFAHAALAEPETGRLRHAERSAREGFDLAYAREGRMDVRVDDWSLRELDSGRMEAVAAGTDFALRLTLAPSQPMLLQGEGGYSRKGPAPLSASYYYSLPQLSVSGELVIDGRRRTVTRPRLARPRMVEREARLRGPRVGLDWHQSRRRRQPDGVPDARGRGADALGRGHAAIRRRFREHVCARCGRVVTAARVALAADRDQVPRRLAPPGRADELLACAADRRCRARFPRQHRHDLLGRTGPPAR